VDGVIHWVSADRSVPAEVRLYDRLFRIEDPAGVGDGFTKYLNQGSLETLPPCYVEESLKDASPEARYQFERLGYFCVDVKDSTPGKPVFNRIASLRDSWTKIAGQEKG
jgi:glutaminyl-tRNA synthetase